MKKKLLITMGCSWTEGYGCYDDSTIPNKFRNGGNLSPDMLGQIQSKNFHRFHEFGWPVLLAKKLGYHKLINMGFGGSSTSGQLKRYYEIYYDEKFEEYDVTIIWFLTHPTRFSFYTNYAITDIMPGVSELGNLSHDSKGSLGQKYLEYTQDWQVDTTLEQLFHIKSMKQLCDNNQFKLIITHSDIKSDSLLKYYYNSDIYLNPIPQSLLHFLEPSIEHSSLCNHPNEKGYKKITELMYGLISKYHPNVVNTNSIPKLEWSWVGGNRISWFPPNDQTMEELIGCDSMHQKLLEDSNNRYLL